MLPSAHCGSQDRVGATTGGSGSDLAAQLVTVEIGGLALDQPVFEINPHGHRHAQRLAVRGDTEEHPGWGAGEIPIADDDLVGDNPAMRKEALALEGGQTLAIKFADLVDAADVESGRVHDLKRLVVRHRRHGPFQIAGPFSAGMGLQHFPVVLGLGAAGQ